VPRRSLLLAGGGLKVAYQAGVLQVWLDELGVEFDHADGVSAGVFNLAMWCQGMSGSEIADNWRAFRPLSAVSVDLAQLARLPAARSLLSFRRFRRNVLPAWGLDWDAIRASSRQASFNVFDFTAQQLRVIGAAQMTEDFLAAAVALPMWFAPVRIDGHTYVDAVHATGANVEHAIACGADELWIIWTTSTRGAVKPGFVNEYFQIFEECTNSRLASALERIERNNRAFSDGSAAEFGRHVEVRLLKAEVPLHYLLNFRNRVFIEAVDCGVRDAWNWCREHNLL
jgi:predicted acylesterase/phospholipase RssA